VTVEDLSRSGTVASVFEPAGEPVTAVVACHGGLDGLDDLVVRCCRDLASSGAIVVAPHYRGEDGVSDPAERRIGETDVDDALTSLQWLEGKVAFPPFVWGNSRGGLVALLAAASSSVELGGCVATSPIDSLAHFHDIMSPRGHDTALEIERRLGGSPALAPEAYEDFDGALVGRHGVPVFLAHAADDPVVPLGYSVDLAGRIASSGSSVGAMFVPSGGHRVIDTQPAVWTAVIRFLGLSGAGALAKSADSVPTTTGPDPIGVRT
jgi:dipeptidyl aminopeptidase/acylaminoacyl peptidase